MQAAAGNRAVAAALTSQPVVQRDKRVADAYTPPEDRALHPTFGSHHTLHGEDFEPATASDAAIENHDKRPGTPLNTTIDMTRADARNEIYGYLLALDANASRAVEHLTHVKFTTTNEYQYVVTRWIVDGAQVKEIYAAKVTVVMEYLENVGYFRIYHMDGTA